MTRKVALVGVLSFLAATGIAFAQTTQQKPGWFEGSQNQFQQMIASRLTEFSRIQNKSVCTTATDGYASCGARVVTDSSGRASSSASTPPSTALGPAQLNGAYGLGGASTGTIGIVDAYNDPNIAKDLATYDSYYGLPNFPTCGSSITLSCFQVMNENGTASPLPASNASWSLEISLDVEVAHAVCPGCRILLVEANSSSFTDLLKAVDTAAAKGATVVNGSWGGSESSAETGYDSTYFAQPAKAGVAFTFSAGDGGYVTSYPAASPYVTSVGGTSLILDGNNYAGESVWDSSLGATGSGCSKYESQPTWQTSLLTVAQKVLCPDRVMNDVAADADPASGAAVYDSVSYDGVSGWFQVGGTSLASPLIAATYALAGGVPSGVYANSLPYAEGNSQGSSANLHDVQSGSDGSCGGSYLCTAFVGYDGPTGLGTPAGLGAFTFSPSSQPPPPPPPPPSPSFSLSASPTSLTVSPGGRASDTITVLPAAGFSGSVTLSVSGLPSGASASFSKDPTKTSSSLTISLNRKTAAGTYAITVKGTSGSLSGTAAITLSVN